MRWGLLGTARINRRLIPAMRAVRRSHVVAVASRDLTRASAYADDWQIPSAYGSYDELLRDRQVDAVYIPLPNSLHVQWTLRALDAGKHVLCEKPLALTPEDVDRIAAVSRAQQRLVVEGFMFRHEPLTTRLVDVVRSGVIGTPQRIDTGFTFVRDRSPDVRLDATLGGGSLWDIGCYAVNIARLVAGREPRRAIGVATMTPTGVDESFSGILQFGDGLAATVYSGFRSPYQSWLELGGTDGSVRVRNPFRPGAREVIEIRAGDSVTQETVAGSSLLFVRQVEDFIAAAFDERAPTVSLSDSRGNAAALAALHASAREARAVTI